MGLKTTLLVLLFILSFLILLQDLRDRLVSLWLLMSFGLLNVVSVVSLRGLQTLFENSISISVYMGLLYLILRLYFNFKYGKSQKIFDTQIGWADILIIFFIGVTFNMLGLILFFSVSFVISLILAIMNIILFSKKKSETIPLAGFLVAIYFIAIMLLSYFEINIYIDCCYI